MIKDFDSAYMDFGAARDYPPAVQDEPSIDGMQLAAGPSPVVSDAGAAFGVYPGAGKRSQKSDIGERMILGAPDAAAGAARGVMTSGLGMGGDLEKLGKFIYRLAADSEGGSFMDRLGRAAGALEERSFLPSSEDVSKNGYTIPGTNITLPPLPQVVPEGTSAFGLTPDQRQTAAGVGQVAGELVGDPLVLAKGAKAVVKGAKMLPKNLPVGLSTEAVGGMEGVLQPVLSRAERSVVTAAAGRKPALRETATKAVEDMHANYPESEGWMPIEASKIDFKTSKSGDTIAEVEAGKIPYDFHTPPEGVPKEAWQSTLASRVFDEVQAVVDRAKAGDQAAIAILEQASWYRSMRDRLRAEFGGIGDVFADVLGTTSAQTGVEQNFDNAVEILRRFSRGEYDKELRAYEDRLKSGQPVDAKTLTQLYKDGEFPLITKASGQLFNANSPPSMGALLDLFRAVKAGDSPKTPNFTGNLIGLTNEATIDVWAARMLRRIADLPRIPPPAEKGVAGKHLVGSTLYDPKVGSEFGFGQDVFREAADEINKSGIIKSAAPQIGDLGPDDLQAVAWFIEKEKWTNNGWTTKAGEGGSLDYEMSLAGAADPQAIKDLRRDINKGFKTPEQRKTETDEQYAARVQEAKAAFESDKVAKQQQLANMEADVDRFTLGVSGERPNRPMSNYAQAELAAEFDDVVRDDASVVTYNLANTYGSFMAQTERALNAEFVTRQNFNPAPLERRLVEQGKAYDQDAVFMSKVLKDGTSPNARPGVEVYFKQKITPDQMAKVTEKLREYGVDGFTYVTDMRFSDRINVQARAGGADTAGLNGLRFQYIPEFDDAYNAANRAQIMAEKQRLFDKVVTDIIGDGNVSDARLVWYDTKVYFRSDYDAYLARNVEGARAAPGEGSPSGANVTQSNRSGKVGKELSGTVSDRRSRQAGILSEKAVNRGRSAPQQGAN
jgi:hypothetical protein